MSKEAMKRTVDKIKSTFWEGYLPEPVKCKYPKCSYPCSDLPDCRDAQQALDKKAENTRELGLDYEPAPVAKPHEQEPVLQDIEQYRLQMAGISTAAIGYWKEGDGIHPDYDTVALRDVAKLYAKYDALYKAQPAQQEPMALEPAPDNSLPKWDECALRVSNSELIAKRVTEGGYGPDHNAKLASALHRFIYEYDDADPYRSGWFLHRLEQVISECTSPPAQRTWVGLSDEEKSEIKKQANYNWETTAGEYASKVQDLTEAKLKEMNT